MTGRYLAAGVAAVLLLSACSVSESSQPAPTPTTTPFGTTIPSDSSPSPTATTSATAIPTVTPLPTAAPTPTPPPSGCRAGNRVAAGAQQTFTKVPNAGHAVALTLDMGGRLDPGIDILNFLIANEVCATIFPTGAMAQTAEGQQIMAIIRAHPELFEIGNHTMHHCNLVSGGGGSPTAAPCAGV